MKDGICKKSFEGGDGGLSDTAGDFLSVLLPKALAQVGDVLRRHGRKTIPPGPLDEAKFQLGLIVFLGGKDLVQQRTFGDDGKICWMQIMKEGTR